MQKPAGKKNRHTKWRKTGNCINAWESLRATRVVTLRA
jgi:hypothetical protein